MTLNQVQAQLREIATNHQQINTFGWGELPELGKSSDVVYPLMWVVQQPSNVDGNNLRLRYKIVFADLVLKDISNEDDVLNDQMQIALDVVAQLNHPDYEWQFENKGSFENFYNEYDDIVTGWVLDCELIIDSPYNRCAIPFDPSPTPETEIGFVTIYDTDGITVVDRVSNNGYYVLTGGTCADATVENSDASYTNTVASGGTLVTPDVLFSIDNSVGNYISSYYPSVKDVTVTLDDTQYDIYVNGAFDQTVYLPALKDDTININAV